MIKIITFSAIISTIFLLWFISSYSIKKPFVKYIVISILAHMLLFSYINVINVNKTNLYSYDGKLADKSRLKKQNTKKNKNQNAITKIQNYNNNEIIFLKQENNNKQNKHSNDKENETNITNRKRTVKEKISQRNKPHTTKALKENKTNEIQENEYEENQDTLTDEWLDRNNKLKQYVYKRERTLYLIDPNKTGWQKFDFNLSLLDDNNEFSISGFDEFTHKSYMQHILETVGYKWFYQYAPIEQIARNIMKIDKPIVVRFDLDKKGNIKNLQFIQKGIINVQNEAVRRTFNTVRLEKVPDSLLYRNINMKFIIHPPTKKKNNNIYIKGTIQIDGEVKIDR